MEADIPIGFGMALAMNAPAMAVYAAMPEEKRHVVLTQARSARSKQEMHRIVQSLVSGNR